MDLRTKCGTQVDSPLKPRLRRMSTSLGPFALYFRLDQTAAPNGLTSTLIYFIDVSSPRSSAEGYPLLNVIHDSKRSSLLAWLRRCYLELSYLYPVSYTHLDVYKRQVPG